MEFVRRTSTAALFLLFGTIVPAYAQRPQESEKQEKPEAQQVKQQPHAQPAQQPKQQRAPQAKPQQPKQERAQQAKPQQPKQERAQQAKPQQPKQERAQQAKPQQPKQERAQQTKPQQPKQQRAQQAQKQQPKQQKAQQTQQARQAQPGGHPTHVQAVAWQKQQGWQQGGGWQAHSSWQQDRDQNWDRDHRTWAQRGGYGGYYIPQSTYNLSFGSEHWFRIPGQPAIYMGYPRFSYGGFWFLLVDPWPGSWAENWYSTDDVYIDYADGYYLCNRTYPGVRLAITVSL